MSEARLDFIDRFKFRGGYIFKVDVIATTYSQYETRSVRFKVPLLRGELVDIVLDECGYERFISFFTAHRGGSKPFRFRYDLDCTATAIADPLNGSPDFTSKGSVINANPNSFRSQLCKKWESSDGLVCAKPIFKPVPGTVSVRRSGALDLTLNENLIDYTNGGVYLNWGFNPSDSFEFQYDLPVVFEGDAPVVTTVWDEETDTRLFRLDRLGIREILLPAQPPIVQGSS